MTSGERLFAVVRDEVLPARAQFGPAWQSLRETLDNIGGSPGLHDYFTGAAAVIALRRMVQLWRHDVDTTPRVENARVRAASKLLTEAIFPGLDSQLAGKVARQLVEAVENSNRDISKATRSRVLAVSSSHRCYICNWPLSKTAKEKDPGFLTLEHLWPKSLGGDSVEENLLPACKRCQDAKADGISWEWVNVHNWVLPPSPSSEALKSIPWSVRIARHHSLILEVSRAERKSLKTSALQLGPFNNLFCESDDSPVTFFDLRLQ